jgi:protein OS-9
MLAPKTFDQIKNKRPTMILAKAKPKAEGGQVESVSDADLIKMDVDVKTVATLKRELKKAAKDLGWRIELYAEPGNNIRVVGIIDDPPEEKAQKAQKATQDQKEPNEQEEQFDEEAEQAEEGSQEVFKDEL